jgi:hypothetical protein
MSILLTMADRTDPITRKSPFPASFYAVNLDFSKPFERVIPYLAVAVNIPGGVRSRRGSSRRGFRPFSRLVVLPDNVKLVMETNVRHNQVE